MNKPDDITDQACLQMGRSMLAFGLKYAMNLLQAQTEILERELVALTATPANGNGKVRPAMERTMALIEEAKEETLTVRELKGKPSGQRNYWAQFTPEERSKEMRRRQRVAERRRRAAAA